MPPIVLVYCTTAIVTVLRLPRAGFGPKLTLAIFIGPTIAVAVILAVLTR